MSIRISMTIAEANTMMECVSSGMEWAEGQIRSDAIDDDVKRNIAEKSVLLGQIGLKLIKQLTPYLESEPPRKGDAGVGS